LRQNIDLVRARLDRTSLHSSGATMVRGTITKAGQRRAPRAGRGRVD